MSLRAQHLLRAGAVVVLALLGVHGSFHCAERRDISPCSCAPMHPNTRTIDVTCERMTSFAQVVNALQDRFQPDVQISLKVSYSQLLDLPERGFHELRIGVSKLSLRNNNLSQLSDTAFSGLRGTQFLSLADNDLQSVPANILAQMPKVRSLDLSRSHLKAIGSSDLQGLPALEHLVLAGNQISVLEKNSLPRTIRHLHLGRNHIKNLNGTLGNLLDLEWLFLNINHLSSMDGQLPENGAPKLGLLFVSNNQLEHLPPELKLSPLIDSVFAQHNAITALNGVFSRARKLKRLYLGFNKIQRLAADEFADVEDVLDLHLDHNLIYSLNSSLLPIRNLQNLNLTHNLLDEFSLLEFRGLQKLRTVDLSHNRIVRLVGRMENVVDSETRMEELRLEYNSVYSLEGALSGLQGLQRLNLSHNLLDRISPDDLIGLDQLKVLDVSYNRLRTLDETSKTFMPALEELWASHNLLTSLDRDFHGLPALCKADLEHNNISRVHPELTAKTRCTVHGVAGVLRIYLRNNPLECDESLARAMLTFQSNLTELHGVVPCALALPSLLLPPGYTLPSVPGLPGGLPAGLPVLPVPVYQGVPAGVGVAPPAPAIVIPVSQRIAFPLHPIESTSTSTTTTTEPVSSPSSSTTEEPPTSPSPLTESPSPSPTPTSTSTSTTELPASSAEPEVSSPSSTSTLAAVSPFTSTSTATPPPVLKELPPVIQLLDRHGQNGGGLTQPEILVQTSKNLPRLVDAEVLVLSAPPEPPVPADAPMEAPSSPPDLPPSSSSSDTTPLSESLVKQLPVADDPESEAVPEMNMPELPPLIQLLNETAI